LPDPDPLDRLPDAFSAWEALARELPKLLVAHSLRRHVRGMRMLNTADLDERQARRAMAMFSFIGHAYVWGEGDVVPSIPAPLAVPWHSVANRLGRPPVLSYASYALDNWRRIQPAGPIALGNIALIQNFLGGIDEEWFVLVHVEIEAEAAPALRALLPAQKAVAADRAEDLSRHLTAVADAIHDMHETLTRMPEHCDPYIYFHRVRPYIHGWKGNPSLPDGLVYEGVDAYAGRPQHFRGETGAQSGIVPALDAALGVRHAEGPLNEHLKEMREYMPPRHRAFVEALEAGSSIRAFVNAHAGAGALRQIYNACVRNLAEFRALHLHYADRYIHSQSRRAPANPSQVGTGGTPFMPYLQKHRDETLEDLLPG
jgi:indoleamine 2,3-dioxygenase